MGGGGGEKYIPSKHEVQGRQMSFIYLITIKTLWIELYSLTLYKIHIISYSNQEKIIFLFLAIIIDLLLINASKIMLIKFLCLFFTVKNKSIQ